MLRMQRNLVAAALTLGLGLAALPANAATAEDLDTEILTQAEHSKLTDFLTAYGVQAETQAALLNKIRNGESWDSMAGSTPVSTEVFTTARELREVRTFADGSIAVTTMERPSATTSGVTPMSVGGCTMGGVGTVSRTMKGCEVQHNLGLIKMGFYADYKYTYSSLGDPWVKAASIQRVYNPTALVVGGSFAELAVGITRTTAATGLPARARVNMIATVIGQFVSKSCWVQLNVPIGDYALAYTSYSM